MALNGLGNYALEDLLRLWLCSVSSAKRRRDNRIDSTGWMGEEEVEKAHKGRLERPNMKFIIFAATIKSAKEKYDTIFLHDDVFFVIPPRPQRTRPTKRRRRDTLFTIW